MQSLADAIHNRLQTPDVTLTVFPRNQRGNRRQTLRHRGREARPIATVDDRAEPRGGADRAIVLKESVIFSVRIIWREDKNAIHAGLLRRLGHLDREPLPKPDTRDHGHTILDREAR